jgi:RHS repeat-associated protein
MKKTALMAWCLVIGLFVSMSFAAVVTVFGPTQYVRTQSNGPADVYTDTFPATPGGGTLAITNGEADGTNRVSSAEVIINGQEIFGPNDFSQGIYTLEAPVTLSESNSITIKLKKGKQGSYLTVEITQGTGPTVTISANPDTIQAGESSTLTWSSTNADTCVIEPDVGNVDVNGSTIVSPTQTTTYTITATGPEGTATDSTTVTVTTNPPPTVNINADPDTIQAGESSTLSWSSTNADTCVIEPDIGSVDVDGSTSVSPNQTMTYTITATGPGGTATDQTVVTVTGGEPKPDDLFVSQYWDLIPPDATAEYDTKRFSIITGLVQDLNGSPIPDVSITIHGHLEYGTASTDAEGRFSIPVNGGGMITIVYQKQGLITAHRKVHVSWHEIAVTETVQMITLDPVSTTVTFDGNPQTVVTHQSTEVSDAYGTRSCTTVFTGDNLAHEVDEEGNVINTLTTVTTRATEFTTPESMPAILPANSGYTYCAELAVDGVQRVQFDKPVVTWVDNFLGFDVGGIVPVGYYDRDKGEWIPSDNGIVVKLLDTDTNGIVDALDADGDDQPDDINENGSFRDEVTGLDDPVRYQPGATFWRVAVTHFTPWDCNWPYGPPSDAIDPNPEGVVQQEHYPFCKTDTGSYAEDRSRIFHEDIPVPGTDMTLHYASNRVEGYKTVISVPASGATVPASLYGIIVEMNIAGRTFTKVLSPLPNQITEFIWDGINYLGRQVVGTITAVVKIGFVYEWVYMQPSELEEAFAQFGSALTVIQGRKDITIWKKSVIDIHTPPSTIADGWALSTHHYQPNTSTLYKGDGTINTNRINLIETVAGSAEDGYSGDGGPATEAQLYLPSGLAFDASGNLYIADSSNHRIRKIDQNGIITTVAGNGREGFGGDGREATSAKLNHPRDVTFDAAGNLYIADQWNHRIRKVDQSGIITTVAGKRSSGYSGDGGPAAEAELDNPTSVAIDAAGNLYIADQSNYRIRKVDQNGIITTVAGNGSENYSGDGGPAIQTGLGPINNIAVDTAENLYIAVGYLSGGYNNDRIVKVDQSGIITTVAGNGTKGYSGDGGLATQAQLSLPIGVALDAAGNLYIADHFNTRIRKVDQSGIISTVAGNGDWGLSGDGGPASYAALGILSGVTSDASGNLYISDTNKIRKVALSNTLFAEDGLGYIMSSAGQHEKTIDLDTGVIVHEFGYDQDSNLISITDQFGNQTSIQRDTNGIPTSITSPDGLTTQLTIDADNHLTRITYPGGSYYNFEYTSDGLLTAKVEPEGNRFEHLFDSNGKLTDATDEEGGHWQFNKTAYANGDILSEVLTGEGNLTSYLDHTYSTGEYVSTITGPSGSQTLFNQSANGLTVNKSLPCGMDLEFKYDVDSEHKVKFVKEMTESTPAALEKITLRDKTYQDTDSDDIPDLITETVTVNDKSFTLENNVLQSQKTITSPEGRTVTTLYNPDTLMTESMSVPGLFDTTYGYDSHGRLTSVDTNTRGIDFAYNAQGFVESTTDSENHTTNYTYDAVGRVTQVDRPDTTSLWFSYDKNGNMTVLINPSAINHGFGYNKVNLNSSYQTPLSGSYSYLYDKDRRLKQRNFPSGNQINNVYANGRLEQIQTPEGNIDFTYLCGTKVGSITNGTESITYGYDGKLVTSEALTGTLSQSLGYIYNNDFILTGFTYAGATTGFSYDNDGLLTGAGNFTITRNAGNGLPESVIGGSLSLSRTFNGYGEVDAQDFIVSGQNPISWTLTRDNNGRITQKTEMVDGVTSYYDYTYDPMGRLLTVTKDSTLVEEYQYDANGTRNYEMNSLRGITGRSFSYDNEDHLLTVGTDIYQYDLDGFLTSKTAGTDVTTYDYSSRGELLGVTLPDGRIIEYVHDPLGRRIAKKVNGVIVEKYLWQDMTRLLAVYDGSDNLLQRFEYADGRMPVAMTCGGSTYYLTYDQVGSLRVVADASGNVVKRVDYDSFGNIIDDTDPSFEVPFGFAGGLQDLDTGLVRFGYRDYDPDTGRWTAKDPILFAGGDTDLYGYCLNDPINYIDLTGKGVVSFFQCFYYSYKVSTLQTECRSEFSKDPCKFREKYGAGAYPSGEIMNCVKSKDPFIYEKWVKSCFKGAFGPNSPIQPKPSPR